MPGSTLLSQSTYESFGHLTPGTHDVQAQRIGNSEVWNMQQHSDHTNHVRRSLYCRAFTFYPATVTPDTSSCKSTLNRRLANDISQDCSQRFVESLFTSRAPQSLPGIPSRTNNIRRIKIGMLPPRLRTNLGAEKVTARTSLMSRTCHTP
jgi:hypothetical protein